MRILGKRAKSALVVLLIFVVVATYSAYALLQPLPTLQPMITFHFSRPAKTVALAWPDYGSAALGADGFGILGENGDGQPRPTASVIKILTALAVLDKKPLQVGEEGPMLTLTQDDVDSYNHYVSINGSVVQVAVGEQISERQALEALLLPSANNMAETLTRWAFGSIDAYLVFANSYALQLDMTDTTVTDPSGFLPTTISTPHDLILLGQAALKNDVIAQIISQPQAIVPVQGTIYNTDRVLGEDGIVGIKTGNTDQDPGCFLFAAKEAIGVQTITIIGAIMGGPNLRATMADALPLVESATQGFSSVDVVDKSARVANYKAPWQASAYAEAATGLAVVAWDGSTVDASIHLRPVRAPTAVGSTIGTLVANSTSAVPLVLDASIKPPTLLWRLAHPLGR